MNGHDRLKTELESLSDFLAALGDRKSQLILIRLLNEKSCHVLQVDDQAEFDQAFNTLKDSGTVMMHEKNYEKYTEVCWVTDKFGFTWQLLF